MFEDCGWEYLKEFAGYTYFRKPAEKMEKEENIFCGRSIQTGSPEQALPRKSHTFDGNLCRSACEWVSGI